jgi:hypothetical protein
MRRGIVDVLVDSERSDRIDDEEFWSRNEFQNSWKAVHALRRWKHYYKRFSMALQAAPRPKSWPPPSAA